MTKATIPYELIGKFLAGEANPEEVAQLKDWRNEDPGHEEEYLVVATAWNNSFNPLRAFEEKKEAAWQETKEMIQRRETKALPLKRVWIGIAASLLILTVVWVFSTFNNNSLDTSGKQYVSTEKVRFVLLPDGSRVWLNKQSTIKLSNDFNDIERKLTLEGEAFFEVARDEARPFIIVAGSSETKVLGTAFNLNERDSTGVVLTVTEGRVAFRNASNQTGEELTVGEQAFLSRNLGTIEKQDSRDLNVLAWKTRILKFENEPLLNIVTTLAAFHDIEIEVATTAESIILSAEFRDIPVEEALSIINEVADTMFEPTENGYIVKKLD